MACYLLSLLFILGILGLKKVSQNCKLCWGGVSFANFSFSDKKFNVTLARNIFYLSWQLMIIPVV